MDPLMVLVDSHQERSFVSPIKHVFCPKFFMKPRPLTYFRGQTDYLAYLGEKLFWSKSSPDFASKASKSFFPQTSFRFEFFYETAPSPIFGAKRTIWCVWGQNCSGRKTSLNFALKAPKFVFPKNTFSIRIFLRNCTSRIFRAKPKNTFSVRIFLRN